MTTKVWRFVAAATPLSACSRLGGGCLLCFTLKRAGAHSGRPRRSVAAATNRHTFATVLAGPSAPPAEASRDLDQRTPTPSARWWRKPRAPIGDTAEDAA